MDDELFPAERYDRDGHYWFHLNPEDFLEITTAPRKERCFGCKRLKTNHAPWCDWKTQMPFGKYKGTPVNDVPVHYLQFLLDKHVGPRELRQEVADFLMVPYFGSPEEQEDGQLQ